MGLMDDAGAGPVALDTAVFIYFLEEHPRFLPVVEPLFAAADESRVELVTSGVTLLEVLVMPLRAGDSALAGRYDRLLTRSRGLRLLDLDRPLLRAAAHLRATLPIKTPDALQVTAALLTGSTAYVTNDRRLPRIPGLPVLQLADYARGR